MFLVPLNSNGSMTTPVFGTGPNGRPLGASTPTTPFSYVGSQMMPGSMDMRGPMSDSLYRNIGPPGWGSSSWGNCTLFLSFKNKEKNTTCAKKYLRIKNLFSQKKILLSAEAGRLSLKDLVNKKRWWRSENDQQHLKLVTISLNIILQSNEFTPLDYLLFRLIFRLKKKGRSEGGNRRGMIFKSYVHKPLRFPFFSRKPLGWQETFTTQKGQNKKLIVKPFTAWHSRKISPA